MAKQLSETIEGAHDFNLVVNNGTNAGQVVPHLHMHFLAGKRVGLLGL
jgi:diadenosine tetraphosphate (Ap4A) HIT family hydrolase